VNESSLFDDYPPWPDEFANEQTYTWVWVICEHCGAANSAIEPEVTLTVCGSCGGDMSPEDDGA
jgi:hypothetical protein